MTITNDFNHYLANLAVMNFKLHNLHWNVEGLQFASVHSFTEDAYNTLFKYFDDVAEIQKMYDTIPDSTLADYLKNATIKEEPAKKFTPNEVFEILKADYTALREEAADLRKACNEKDWFSSATLLEDQIAYYNKQLWFIKAILG